MLRAQLHEMETEGRNAAHEAETQAAAAAAAAEDLRHQQQRMAEMQDALTTELRNLRVCIVGAFQPYVPTVPPSAEHEHGRPTHHSPAPCTPLASPLHTTRQPPTHHSPAPNTPLASAQHTTRQPPAHYSPTRRQLVATQHRPLVASTRTLHYYLMPYNTQSNTTT